MSFDIVTGHGVMRRRDDELLILASRLRVLRAANVPFVFTDRHACSRLAIYRSSIDELDLIDWTILQGRDFRGEPDDPEKPDRYQAEALAYRHLPVEALIGIICCTGSTGGRTGRELEVRGLSIRISVRGGGYF